MDLTGDVTYSLTAVIDGVHSRHYGEQHLSRANVGSRLLPFYVLLPCLQGHSKGPVAVGVDRDTNNSTRDQSLVLINSCKIGRMRAAEPKWNSKTLGRSNRYICTHLGRRFQNSKAEKVCRDNDFGPLNMGPVDEFGIVEDLSVFGRILHDATEAAFVKLYALVITDHQVDPQRFRPGNKYVQGLG